MRAIASKLSPSTFSNVSNLTNNANLGRLTVLSGRDPSQHVTYYAYELQVWYLLFKKDSDYEGMAADNSQNTHAGYCEQVPYMLNQLESRTGNK